MSLLVLVTDNCKQEATKHNLLQELDRFKERVEQTQGISHFDPFPPPYLVKKKFGGRQGRLIAEKRVVGEHLVVIFLTVLIRGDRAYEDFVNDPVGYGERTWAHLVNPGMLERHIEDRNRRAPPPEKQPPTPEQCDQLYSIFTQQDSEQEEHLVSETAAWIEQVGTERIDKQLNLVCAACLKLLSRDEGLQFEPIENKPGWGVWGWRDKRSLLLLAVSTDGLEQESKVIAQHAGEKLKGAPEAMERLSRRAYPAIMLADDELWIDLEREKVANMALSMEELEVLKAARNPAHAFPLFINGRAGSGKSTILQYLFADVLYYRITKTDHTDLGTPLYLTANGELLKRSRNFIEKLLISQAKFAQNKTENRIRENKALFDEAFCTFKEYLLSFLSDDESRQWFSAENYVDYAAFKRMWTEKFQRNKNAMKEFGPDISWHVIRTYIKGTSSETLLDPEDYPTLPENQLTVTTATYRKVYENVWPWYSDLTIEKRTHWDDQDLTRCVLDNEWIRPKHSAVFCDEAQDFTRIELELLLRLNLYSERKLRPQDITRVPFAFAGDQFQTLNPTGFRWDSIKASFAEKFIFALDPARRSGRTELNYRELEYNYRSTPSIVYFSNAIQALRSLLFHIPGLRPQRPWDITLAGPPVVWFSNEDTQFWRLCDEHGGYIIIVPCMEGEEKEFVQSDPILRQHVRVVNDVPQNVLSAVRAKGCEYPEVILYGFGASLDTDIVSLVSDPDSSQLKDPDKSLPLQYFINRLYVGASRAKRQLIVVDSADGFRRLWTPLQDANIEELLVKVKNGSTNWAELSSSMIMGRAEHLDRNGHYDPLDNARAFEVDAKARNDAFLYKQAAGAYRVAGQTSKADEMMARAAEADRDYLKAGELFFKAGFGTPDGLQSYWRAGKPGWEQLVEKVSSNPNIRSEMEFLWSKVICRSGSLQERAQLLQELAEQLTTDLAFRKRVLSSHVWRSALEELLRPVFVNSELDAEGRELPSVVTALDAVIRAEMVVPDPIRAQVNFLSGRYREAITIWEQIGQTKSRSYFRAKARSEAYPGNIIWLDKLEEKTEIVRQFDEGSPQAITAEATPILLKALQESKRFEDAVALAFERRQHSALIDMATKNAARESEMAIRMAVCAGIYVLSEEGRWDKIFEFLSHRPMYEYTANTKLTIEHLVDKERFFVESSVVLSLASLSTPLKVDSETQKRISEFLRVFVRRSGEWRQYLTQEVMGAAFERTGRHIDAASFYENLSKEGSDRVLKGWSHQRWLKCRYRQLEHERAQPSEGRSAQVSADIRREEDRLGRLDPNTPDYPDVKKIEKLNDLGKWLWLPREEPKQVQESKPELNPESKPELSPESKSEPKLESRPELNPEPKPELSPEPKPESRLEVEPSVFGKWSLKVSRKLGRCNLEHMESLESAWVKVRERQCGGEGNFIQEDPLTWYSEEHGFRVRFLDVPSQTAVTMECGGEEITIEM